MKNNINLFESYLREVHAKENSQVLDEHELPPYPFEYWLMHQNCSRLIKFGNEALVAMKKKYEKEIRHDKEEYERIIRYETG